MATYLPPDLQQEQEAIARQRMMAQALQQSESPQGQMVSGRYVAPSITQYLAQGLKQYRGNQDFAAADKRQKALAEALDGRRSDWMKSMPQATPERVVDTGMGPPTEQGVMSQKVVPGTNPTSQDYLKWGMQGMNVDPQSAQLGMKMADSMEAREARAETLKAQTQQRMMELRQRSEDQRLSAQDRQQAQIEMAKLTASLRPEPNPNLVQVVGDDGNPIYLPAKDAVGKPAYIKEGANKPANKLTDAKEALDLIDQTEKVIDAATGSGFGNALDSTAAFFGKSTGGAQAAAKLKAIEGMLVSKMPKMSGPQSDKDVLLYKQMAAQIGDPNVPRETKKAALAEVKKIQRRYAGLPEVDAGATGGWDPSAQPAQQKNIVVNW